MIRLLVFTLCLGASLSAQAYCIHNQLKLREVVVEQEPHPDKARDERRLRATLKPGERVCCPFHRLDCNPGGRQNSVVSLSVAMPDEPAYACGYPAGREPNVKVTGAGSVRIVDNPRYPKVSAPYVVRIRTHDRQDLTGPRGLACPAAHTKGK